MIVKELIEQLKGYNQNDEVVFMDNEYWFMRIDIVYIDRKEKVIDWEVWFKERVVLDYNAKQNG